MPYTSHTSYPDHVSSTAAKDDVRYERQPRRACVNDEQIAADHTVIGEIESVGLIVEAAESTINELIRDQDAVAAYSFGDGPVSFAPTGRVFVRVDREESLAAYVDQLESLGLVIDMPHPRFEFAGWLVSATGSKSEALAQCDALLESAFLVHVEPEMLTMREKRSD